ncbi:MAG: LacI family DNA-binding transcriptional regulator [Lachnospiraceae bacterium]|nr:LacI family DNA-binding transcriptional regulator [Lachnospiraceae bacterium]
MSENNIKIDDVAKALGISKTTVSRSLSGKGRISEATRQKVLDYVESHNYRPNPIAKGLANSKTYNIAWVVPANSDMNALSFFQRCLGGVINASNEEDYDIIITTTHAYDNRRLKKLIDNRKVDGVILGQTLVDDINIKLLADSGMPFVVIGSTNIDNVTMIDNDHSAACRELTAVLVMKGLKRIAYIGGDSTKVVNITRRDGFIKGCQGNNSMIRMDCNDYKDVAVAVDEAIEKNSDCIVCEDDRICQQVLAKLEKDMISVPEQIKIASFYNSTLLENNKPPITSLQYDPRELGKVAVNIFLKKIDNKEVPQKTILGYEVLLKGSTQ